MPLSLTLCPVEQMRKKARALPNFASGADAYAHTSLGRAHQTHKKGLYHKLKNQVCKCTHACLNWAWRSEPNLMVPHSFSPRLFPLPSGWRVCAR
jgi:hypothetical protein